MLSVHKISPQILSDWFRFKQFLKLLKRTEALLSILTNTLQTLIFLFIFSKLQLFLIFLWKHSTHTRSLLSKLSWNQAAQRSCMLKTIFWKEPCAIFEFFIDTIVCLHVQKQQWFIFQSTFPVEPHLLTPTSLRSMTRRSGPFEKVLA